MWLALSIKKAGEYMRRIGASFLFTGEVLGQRPMSQHGRAMDIIDRESGFMGYILRPLSAARLEPTEPELNGLVDRSKLLGITGRSRKTQISPASQNGIREYPCPAGGCLLTDKNFADKIRDYFNYTEHPSLRDIPLLKMGRHFRLDNGDKIIVARNEHESKSLKDLCRPGDHLLAPLSFSGPSVVLQGTSIPAAVEKIARYTKGPLRKTDSIIHRFGGKEDIMCLRDYNNG